jgi:hypothetical protein
MSDIQREERRSLSIGEALIWCRLRNAEVMRSRRWEDAERTYWELAALTFDTPDYRHLLYTVEPGGVAFELQFFDELGEVEVVGFSWRVAPPGERPREADSWREITCVFGACQGRTPDPGWLPFEEFRSYVDDSLAALRDSGLMLTGESMI